MPITLDMVGDVAIIKMDDGKRNAINPTFVDRLFSALDEAEAKAKCVVLTGRDGAFSAGFDLKFVASQPQESALDLARSGGKLVTRLLRFPMPVVAASTGHGIAMGTFMLLACDFRYGVSGPFYYGANETLNDMILPAFGIHLIRERVPVVYRGKMAAEGHLVSPDIAVEYGILDHVVPPEELLDKVMAHAEALSKTNTYAFTQNRLLIRQATLEALDASNDMPVQL